MEMVFGGGALIMACGTGFGTRIILGYPLQSPGTGCPITLRADVYRRAKAIASYRAKFHSPPCLSLALRLRRDLFQYVL